MSPHSSPETLIPHSSLSFRGGSKTGPGRRRKSSLYLVVLAQKLSGTTVNIVLHALPAGKKKIAQLFFILFFRFGSVFNFSAPRASRASRGFTCCVNVLHVLSPWASKSSGESHIIRKPPKKKRNYFMNNQQHETQPNHNNWIIQNIRVN